MRTLLTLISAFGVLAAAQERGLQTLPAVVRATGEAVVSVRADQTALRLSVVSTGRSAERAGAKNAEKTTDVITRLRELLGQDANIRTVDYSSNKSKVDGYVAVNTIEVHVPDPAMATKAIDAASKYGATVIGGMQPSALNEQNARAEALKQATVRARADAEAMAAALGMRVVRVLSAETAAVPAPAQPPLGPMELAKRVAPPTPIEAGSEDLRVHVSVTLEVAPQATSGVRC
ncbi:MAG: SIMPL domain-containing protein [Bryobacteraceae bacterium]|jgi:uncharacterized protein YggE